MPEMQKQARYRKYDNVGLITKEDLIDKSNS